MKKKREDEIEKEEIELENAVVVKPIKVIKPVGDYNEHNEEEEEEEE